MWDLFSNNVLYPLKNHPSLWRSNLYECRQWLTLCLSTFIKFLIQSRYCFIPNKCILANLNFIEELITIYNRTMVFLFNGFQCSMHNYVFLPKISIGNQGTMGDGSCSTTIEDCCSEGKSYSSVWGGVGKIDSRFTSGKEYT